MVSPINILQFVSTSDMFAAGLIMPQLPPHAHRLGLNHIQIGLLFSVYSAFQLISGQIVRNLCDVKSRKTILLACLSICVISYIHLGLTESVLIFFALRAILGSFKQTQDLTKVLTPDYEKDAKKQSILQGRSMLLSAAAMSIGLATSGHIMEAYPKNGFTIIAIIVGTIFATNTGLIYLLPEIKKKENNKTNITSKILDSITDNMKQSVNEFYNVNWNIYWDIFLFQVLIALSIGLYFGTFALFLIIKHRLTSMYLGYISSFQAAIGTFLMYFIGYVNKFYSNDKDCSQRIFHLFVLTTVSFIAMAIVPNVSMFVGVLILKSISDSVGKIITFQMITSRSKDNDKAALLGASNTLRSLSGVIIPLVGGVIMQYFGVLNVFYVAACFTSVGIVLSYRLRSKTVNEKAKKN